MLKLKEINLIEIYGKKLVDKWQKKYPIFKNEDVLKWIKKKNERYGRNGKELNKFGMTTYLKPLQEFCDHYEVLNPSDLLKENIDDRNKRVMNYLTKLINDGKNEVSVRNMYQSRIKSFYSDRGSPISDGLETLDSGLNRNEIYLDRKTIQKIENRIANKNYKILIKLQSLLGLRISDAIEEITAEINGEPKYNIEKHKDHYFISNFRTFKENVSINYLIFPKELTTIIQSIYSIDDLTKLELNKKFLRTRNGNLVIKHEYLRTLKKAVNELKLGKVMRTHSFRKYFSTQISKVDLTKTNTKIGTDIEINFKEHLMAHKVHYSSKVYKQIIQNIDNFYNLWKPLESSLCIDCQVVDNTNQDILELKKDKVKLEKQINTLINKNIEFEEKIKENDEWMAKFAEIINRITDKMDLTIPEIKKLIKSRK